MENYFEKFIKEEYDWLYGCDDGGYIIMDECEMSEEEYYDNLDDFIEQATKRFCNDEYVIQTLHELMHDHIYNVVNDYNKPRD